jgi:LuxR family maltose regulon positive regulatory protein
VTLALVPIGTKASVPRLPEPWNGRPRLNDRCARVRPGEAMLVVAFPGAGKTTLLTDWITNYCDAANRAWLTLDARDNAPGRLGTLLAYALGVDAASDDLSGRHCSDTVVIDRIFEALDARAERTVLVLDDVHEITSRPALAALSHLVLSLPPTLSVFLATRADPPLPIQRLQFDGRLHQLRTSDLALTQYESEELFRSHAVTLASDDIESLRTRTGGWAGGMRLAALALGENADPELFVENVVRTEALISDYLVREVLDSQTPEMRRFLLRSCVAQVLTKELARELSGDRDSDARLEQLERSGVFVTQGRDSRRTFQVHALFGALLRARLRHDEPEVARALLTRAARWFDAHDMPVEGERHAYEAGDLRLAGSLSCRRFVQEALSGAWRPGDVPVSVAETATVRELVLIAAANATAVLDRRNAVMWRSRLDVLCAAGETSDDRAGETWFGAARLLLDVFYGRALGTDARSLSACRALMSTDIGAHTPALHAVVRLREAELLLDSEDDEAPLRALLDARWLAVRNAAPWVVDECDILLALIASVRGRLDSCDSLLQGLPPRGEQDPVADTLRLARALCDAQRGRVNTARAALVSQPSSALGAHAVRRGAEVAIRLLDVRRDSRPAPEPEHENWFGRHVRIALGAIDGPGMGRAESTVAAARGLFAKERDEEVLKVLDPCSSKRAVRDNLRTRIEALTLAAIAADRLGNHEQALSYLQDGLDLAAPADLRAPFLDHAPYLGGMVDRYSWQLAGGYAAELVDDLHPGELPVFVEPLTARERAVLEYLPTMMTNTEIAHQLLVSVNTVKTHLKSVYRKLGVDRRRDAVIRAKQLEILERA